MSGLRAAAATLRAAAAEVWCNRKAFWVQVVAMAVNDLVWVIFWLLFFGRVGSVRGWDASRVLVFQAALTTAGGLALGLAGNARRLGSLVADGGLDAALALPVSPLNHLLVRRIEPAHLGDLAFGIVLFTVAGSLSAARVVVFVTVVLAAALTLVGFLILTGSSAFFVGRSEPGDLSFHAIILLAAYPADIFTGAPRLLVHTAIPAAFIATVPATLVDSFEPVLAGVLVAAAAAFAGAGWLAFTLGLRRYTSGSMWTNA